MHYSKQLLRNLRMMQVNLHNKESFDCSWTPVLMEKRRHNSVRARLHKLEGKVKKRMLQKTSVKPNVFVLPWPNEKRLFKLWI
jgi:hypothetical protein